MSYSLKIPTSIILKQKINSSNNQTLQKAFIQKYFLFLKQIQKSQAQIQQKEQQLYNGEDLYADGQDQNQQQIQNEQSWVIIWGNYQKVQFPEVLQQCEQLKVNKLTLFNNIQPKIISQLSQCNLYSKLKWLNISANQIVSIQSFQKLQCPNLKGIAMFSNLISNFLTLKKTFFPELEYLSLAQNLHSQFQQLPYCLISNIDYISMRSGYNLSKIKESLLKSSIKKLKLTQLFHCQFPNYQRMKQILKLKFLEARFY